MEKGQVEPTNQKSSSDGEYLPIPKRICRQSRMYDNPNELEGPDNSTWIRFKSFFISVLININNK